MYFMPSGVGETKSLVDLGFRNYIKTAGGGGRSALPSKKFKIWLKTNFLKVCHGLYYIKIIILKIGFERKKKLPKKVTREKP